MNREYSPNEPELQDVQPAVTPELERSLASLEALNRHFGGHALIRRFLRAWLGEKRTYRVLDLATGAGDIPRLIVRWGQQHGLAIEVVAVDANASTLEIARRQSTDFPQISWVCADALAYEAPSRFDLVCCSLALHHFSEEEAAKLLRQIRRLTRQFALVVDLERSPITTAAVWLATTLFYTEPMTHHDGMLSVRRAFSFQEMRELAESAGWSEFRHTRFFPCRQALWFEGRDVGDIPVPVLPEAAMPCPG